MSMWILKAFFCNLASYAHICTHPSRGHPLCRDTTLSWSETCKNPCQVQIFQWVLWIDPVPSGRRSKSFRTHSCQFGWGRNCRTWLCTCQGGRTPRLYCEPCCKHHHTDSPGGYQLVSISPTDSVLGNGGGPSWSHDKKGTISYCGSKDLADRARSWTDSGPRKGCTAKLRCSVFRKNFSAGWLSSPMAVSNKAQFVLCRLGFNSNSLWDKFIGSNCKLHPVDNVTFYDSGSSPSVSLMLPQMKRAKTASRYWKS